MANVKITQLPLATTPLTGTEVFPLVQGTTTKQVAITGLFTSPVMTNPTLGTVGQADLINATGLPIASGVSGLGAGIATFLGTPSSANLRTAVTDETGTGALVFANAPVLVAPDLGTPSVLVATNATGTAVGLTAGSAITNANLTGAVTSVGNATSLGSFTSAQLRTALTDETGAGVAVFATSPTITAPLLNQINDTNNAQILGLSPTTSAVDYLVVKNGIGVAVPLHFYADGSSANIGLHIQPKGTGLVTISDGTDFNKGIRFRSSSSAASAITLLDAVSTAGRVVTLPDATTTLVGRDTTDTLTNKTIAFSSNTFSGTLAIANGGTGQATANAALNALLPAQTGNASKYLQTDGTNSSWDAISLSTADITGTLGTANGGTGLTSFTSGGVVYASSASALATGSGLTYNGTLLTTTAADAATVAKWKGSTGLLRLRPYVDATIGAIFESTNAAESAYLPLTLTGSNVFTNSDTAAIWKINNTEGMRLTSTGLGIGTSSPTRKLDVNGDINVATGGVVAWGGTLANYITANTASNLMAFNVNSSERMRITSAGDVGIGTSSPAYKLDIKTSSGVETYAVVGDHLDRVKIGYSANTGITNNLLPVQILTDNTGNLLLSTRGTNASSLIMYTSSGSTATERMRLDSTGNLGLGVTPSAWSGFKAFDVNTYGCIAATTSEVDIVGNAYNNGTNWIAKATGLGTRYLQTAGTHYFQNAASVTGGSALTFVNAAILDSSGNLGLGVTPSASVAGTTFQVGARASLFGLTDGRTVVGNNTFYDGSYKYIATATASVYTQVSGQHIWLQAASGTAGNAITFTQAMTLDASGNLGIGTTSPSTKLQVNDTITIGTADKAIQWLNSGTALADIRADSSSNLIFRNTSSYTERAQIDSSGRFAIAVSGNAYSQDAGLTVNGTNFTRSIYSNINGTSTATHCSFANGNGVVGSITTSGSATLYNVTSDERLKENIANADSASSLIDSLQVRKFDWKAEGNHQRYGFVAQELVTVAPEAVYQPTDTDEMMAVDYSKLVPMLVKEIQSLRQRVAQLETN